MGLTTGLMALALCGSDPVPPPPIDSAAEITCQVEVMTVEGLAWRSAAGPMLRPAARQGTATIWTADRDLKGALEKSCQGKAIKAPRVTSFAHAVATINSDKTTDYVRHLDRVAAEGGKSALKPEVATIREGFSAVFSGQRFDQGVLAKVKFAESHIGSMHTIKWHEAAMVAQPGDLAKLAGAEKQIVEAACEAKCPAAAPATIQLPEVFLSEIQGEWLVPDDGILLISMGVNTVADPQGKAVVQERLAIFDFGCASCPAEANGCATPATVLLPAPAPAVASPTPATVLLPAAGFACPNPANALFPACRVDADPAVAMENAANLAMPAVPDRSLPAAYDKDGNAFELPPLPEAYAANDLNQIPPGSPLASPQSRIAVAARSIADPQLARTSLEAIPDHEVEQFAPCSAPAAGLAAVVETFLRRGMDGTTVAARYDAEPCDASCPAQGCPYAVEGCDQAPPADPARLTMGVNMQDTAGTFVMNTLANFSAALQAPGHAEVRCIPLGGGLSLQIEAKVVPTPIAPPASAVAAQPAPTANR